MSSSFKIGRWKTSISICTKWAFVCCSKFRIDRWKIHHPTKSIATIHYSSRTIIDLCPINYCIVDSNYILQMPTSVDGIIHAYTIQYNQDSVCLKSPQNRASSTHLRFLHVDIATILQYISASLWVIEADILFVYECNLIWYFFDRFFNFGTSVHNNFYKVECSMCHTKTPPSGLRFKPIDVDCMVIGLFDQ